MAMLAPMALVARLRGRSLEVSRGVSLGANMGLSREPSTHRVASLGVSNQQVSAGNHVKQTAPTRCQPAVLMARRCVVKGKPQKKQTETLHL